jgi:glycosyltransferase involved in cell wall biosynthesis
MPRVSVVIPALNEEEVIGRTVLAIPRAIASEVIVVDNGSTDRTAEEARKAGARVVVEPMRGYGRACLAGVRSVSADCEIIVLMDADLSDDPSEMPSLVSPIVEQGYDLVLGSRMMGHREKDSMTTAQVLGSRITSLMIKSLYGFRYTDMGPFRAISRPALESLDMRQPTYGWSIEMQVKAASRGLHIKEIPVSWRIRAGGQSKVAGTIRGSIKAGIRIVYTILSVAMREMKG